MAEFTLHDGEDEKKTEELHKFIEDAKVAGADIHDWEGENSGVNIWISVAIGDTMIYDEHGAFTIKKKGTPT